MTTNNIPFSRPERLSEAIRLGTMLTKPLQSAWILRHENGPGGLPFYSACALGAAYIGAFHYDDLNLEVARWYQGPDMQRRLKARFRLLSMPVRHPDAKAKHDYVDNGWGEEQWTVWEVIMSLNDSYGWTREQIADWVEQIENELEPLLEPVRQAVTP